MTIIQFGEGGDSIEGSTFQSYAEEFVAKDITFEVKQIKLFAYFFFGLIIFQFKLIHLHLNQVQKISQLELIPKGLRCFIQATDF